MGKVMSVVAAKAQRFNVENRAQKIISQAKPTPAPRFESNLKDLERVLKGEKILRKHCEIDADNLRFQITPRLLNRLERKMQGSMTDSSRCL